MLEEYEEYLKENSILSENLNIDFNDQLFAYDYNEVQELLFEPNANNFVFLVGEANLRKNDMLGRMCQDLYLRGINKSDILYVNYELPIFNDFDIRNYCLKWSKEKSSHRIYLIVNEIQQIDDWFGFIEFLKGKCINIQLICSSTTPKFIHEKLYDNPSTTNRVVVLSKKNDSNIKYETQGFGVYNDELKYNIKNNIVEIKGMTKEGKKMSTHIVPEFIEGYPVKIISSGAFHHRTELLSISLPDSIEMIGDYAFTMCDNLKEINLPKNLKYIGENAFLGAKRLKYINGGDNVIHIGNSALYNTEWLNDRMNNDFICLGKVLYSYRGNNEVIEIPKNIKVLGNYSFLNSNIKEIYLSSQVFMEGVFYNCQKLEKINGLNINEIPAFTFYNCKKLESIDCLINKIGKFAFYSCNCLEDIKGENIYVGEAALENCNSLSSIGSVVTAKNASFANTNLNEIPTKLLEIGKFAFYNTKIKDVVLQTTKIIDDYAFSNNSLLYQFEINGQTKVGKKILYNCHNVADMVVPGNIKINYYFGEMPTSIIKLEVFGEIIDDFNRNNMSLKSLIVRNVSHFGRWSFYNNNELENLTLVDVTNIGEWSFAYCESLKEVILPSTLNHIGLNGFRYCHNLNKITLLSDKLVDFGNNALYSTGVNKAIYVPSSLLNEYKNNRVWKEYSNSMKELDK